MSLPWESSPRENHKNVTLSDLTTHDPPLVALVCGATGTLVLTDKHGVDATYTVMAGQSVVGQFTKVKASGSTYTGNLVGQY